MQDSSNEIYHLLGQVLFPFAALLCEEVNGARIMLTAVAPPGTSLDTSLLSGQSFFNFHSGQMVGEDEELDPVSVMTFFHATTGTQLTMLMTYSSNWNDPGRFAIAIQVSEPVDGDRLDRGLANVLRKNKFESILVERHPVLGENSHSKDYTLVLEKYRSAIQGRTVKLYLRQVQPADTLWRPVSEQTIN